MRPSTSQATRNLLSATVTGSMPAIPAILHSKSRFAHSMHASATRGPSHAKNRGTYSPAGSRSIRTGLPTTDCSCS